MLAKPAVPRNVIPYLVKLRGEVEVGRVREDPFLVREHPSTLLLQGDRIDFDALAGGNEAVFSVRDLTDAEALEGLAGEGRVGPTLITNAFQIESSEEESRDISAVAHFDEEVTAWVLEVSDVVNSFPHYAPFDVTLLPNFPHCIYKVTMPALLSVDSLHLDLISVRSFRCSSV